MRPLITTALMSLSLCLLPMQALTQAKRMPVHVNFPSETELGRQLAFRVRDRIRSSSTFEEVARDKFAIMAIDIATMDADESGTSSVYSLVIQIVNDKGPNYYVDNYVGQCGKAVVQTCADDIYGALGGALESLRSAASRARSSAN